LKKDVTPENKPRLLKLRDAFSNLSSFDAATLGNTLTSLAAEMGVKACVLVHPTRLACTGKTIGPSLYHLMEVLGKEQVLRRLDRALGMM
jgi:glutamyl/glutaminyl-tRNA synthetase